jgi:uncharacterized Zn finger protein (UPF0148 family)
MEEERIKKITETLLAGGKMLGIHCEECKSPLFGLRGKVICPICGEFGVGKAEEAKPPSGVEMLEKTLHSKLSELAKQLEQEKEPSKTIELLGSIKATLETLERLKKRAE